MDIVDKIGRYFAQHEAQMSDVMRQALERRRALPPSTDAPAPRLVVVAPPRRVQGAFFKESPKAPREATKTSPSSPAPTQVASIEPKTKQPLRRKVAVRKLKKQAPPPPPPSSTKQPKGGMTHDEGWRLSVERAKKIQMDQEAKAKAMDEGERRDKMKRDDQLRSIESMRKQAFAKPQPPSMKPKQLNVSEAWCEPRQRKPRPYRQLGASTMARPSTSPSGPTTPKDLGIGSATSWPSPTSMPRNNNDHHSPSIHPFARFGPAPSATPFLDKMESARRTQMMDNAAAVRRVRDQVARERLVQEQQAELEAQSRRREQSNVVLHTRVQQLLQEKEALEASLQALQHEETEMRSERHRLTMERRMARRAAAVKPQAGAMEQWAIEEAQRAAKAARARELAKRRVQRREAGPETSDDDDQEDRAQSKTRSLSGWHVSPLASAQFEKAFFAYSSSSDDDNN
ncbi:Aste57867_8676 [Aphanomyces stellatus]|uniref:Aste57867_8676 protein n=1 Tax=Aphanomyces stellatus TaxID=120398 RepID=A0A485KL21_9STRA|nr:hypothetical protein As57867_008642 [Aphanomyces stellatus]VFT85562.1 Aste57867_8676 [Aphanomyces stellatus]